LVVILKMVWVLRAHQFQLPDKLALFMAGLVTQPTQAPMEARLSTAVRQAAGMMALRQGQAALAPLAAMVALQVLLAMEQKGLLLLAVAARVGVPAILALAVGVK
jgi:hypothetical protein